MLHFTQPLIASFIRFVNSEVALFVSRTARVRRPRRSARGALGFPASKPRDLVNEGLFGHALSLLRAALEPLLGITAIATLLAIVSPRGDAPPGTGLLERIDVKLRCEPTAPRLARIEIREAAKRGRLPEEESATATLLTSELVTNAVIHPQQPPDVPLGLRISSYEDHFRVEVTDSGTGFDPLTGDPRRRETGGNGLLLVDQLASRWGTTSHHHGQQGFCVWFELERASGRSHPNGSNGSPRGGSVKAGRKVDPLPAED
jgi:anti-sigma regulatory factor (Ser/Thr protein kinase)